MTDARLRDLERKWRETSDEGDLERYVRELVRAGVVPAGTQGTNIPYSELSSCEKTYVRILAEHAQTMAGFEEYLQGELYRCLLAVSIAHRIVEPDPGIPQNRLNSIIAETYAGWLVSDVCEFRGMHPLFISDDLLQEFVVEADQAALRPRAETQLLSEQRRAEIYCEAVNLTRRIIGTEAFEGDLFLQLRYPLLALCTPEHIPNDHIQLALTYARPGAQKTYRMPEFLKVTR